MCRGDNEIIVLEGIFSVSMMVCTSVKVICAECSPHSPDLMGTPHLWILEFLIQLFDDFFLPQAEEEIG